MLFRAWLLIHLVLSEGEKTQKRGRGREKERNDDLLLAAFFLSRFCEPEFPKIRIVAMTTGLGRTLTLVWLVHGVEK